MNPLFMPKEQYDMDLVNLEPRKVEDIGQIVLVYSIGGSIWAIEDFDGAAISVSDAQENNINALCFHKGELYSGNDAGEIYNVNENEIVAKRVDRVNALCSDGDKLYDAGNYCPIFDTLTSEVFAERVRAVNCLATIEGFLFDAGNDKNVYNTKTGIAVEDVQSNVHALHNYDGNLLYGGYTDFIYSVNSSFEISLENIDYATRLANLFTFNDRLYFADGIGQIFDPITEKLIVECKDLGSIIAMPKRYLEVDL